MDAPCLLLPVIQGAFADIVFHRPKGPFGRLDALAWIAVVQYLPNQLFGFVNRGPDDEAVNRNVGRQCTGKLICHDRFMTRISGVRQTPETLAGRHAVKSIVVQITLVRPMNVARRTMPAG